MSASDSEIVLAQRLRTMQVILTALVSGASIFLVIVLFLRVSGKPPNALPTPILTYVGIPLTAGTLLAHVWVPSLAIKTRRRQLAQGRGAADVSPWCDLYSQQMIIGAALLEGTAFFWLISYLLEGSPWSLGIAVLCIGGMALKFPTRPRLERWIDQQLDLAQQERLTP